MTIKKTFPNQRQLISEVVLFESTKPTQSKCLLNVSQKISNFCIDPKLP